MDAEQPTGSDERLPSVEDDLRVGIAQLDAGMGLDHAEAKRWVLARLKLDVAAREP